MENEMSDYSTYILWISSSPPYSKNSTAGGQTFNYYFKNISRDKRFNVRLIALVDSKTKDSVENEMDGIPHKLVSSENSWKKFVNIDSKYNPWTKYSGLISNYRAMRILEEVKNYKKEGYNPDAVILEWTNTVILAKEIKKIFPDSKFVASEHDVTFVGYERKKEYYKGLKKLLWKIKYVNEKRIELDSLKMCELVLPHNADNRNVLVNEGIDLNKIMGLVPYYNNMSECNRNSNQKDILFFGAMARMENSLSALWFIDNVLPLLSDIDIRFVVLGSNPTEELKAKESERIHVTGFVDAVEPYFEKSMCLVAPLVLGAGIKVKVLEAMSSGIPVLTNDIGIEGIPAIDGRDYLHCVSPQEYASAIREIHNNKIDVKNLETNAKGMLKEHFSIEQSLHQYQDKLANIGENI